MDLELLRLRRPHKVSLFLRKTLCKTPHRHSTSNFFWLMFAFPRRCTLLSSSAPLLRRRRSVSRTHTVVSTASCRVAQLVLTLRNNRMLPGALTVRVNVLSVHLKSDLYLDGIWLACVASPSVRSRRLETGLAACVQSEHTPTDTAPVSVHFRFLFGTPLHHPVQAAISRRVVHHAFADRPGL